MIRVVPILLRIKASFYRLDIKLSGSAICFALGDKMREKYLILLSLVVAVTFLSGCATIITGTTQKVPVTSNPSGAVAKADGGMAAVTPTVFILKRKTDHTIEISKEGYRTATVILRHTLSGAAAGNVLVGGIIGIAIDSSSGAMYKLVPERVDVTLENADAQ